MKLTILKSAIYGILGLIFTIGGMIGLFNPKVNVSSVAEEILKSTVNKDNLLQDLLHTTMELGAAITPIGILLIWSAFNPRLNVKLNLFFLLFFLLFSIVHWHEFILGNRQIESPLINSIPVLLIVVIMTITKSNNER